MYYIYLLDIQVPFPAYLQRRQNIRLQRNEMNDRLRVMSAGIETRLTALTLHYVLRIARRKVAGLSALASYLTLSFPCVVD